MDVLKCACTLRLLVHEMLGDYCRRTMNGPLDMEAVIVLIEILTNLVQEECRYNRDIYEGSRWYRNRDPNEPESERNLHAYLIRDHPSSPSLTRDYFVSHRLRAFPAIAWILYLPATDYHLGV